MGFRSLILLSVLATQALTAPSGCIESCTSYQRAYQSQSSNGYQDPLGLTQTAGRLDDLTYSRPGNWTEHNQYRTDGGSGKVHEERGQFVDGPKRVRYYKKNYTSSYGTGQLNGGGFSDTQSLLNRDRLDSRYTIPSGNQVLDTERTYNHRYGGLERVAERQEYSEQSRQHVHSSSRTTGQSQRLEDFGEHSADSHSNRDGDTAPTNWSRVDAYRTDGGHGHVFEEEGQYVTGPKKVRYFKRNYTSSYQSAGFPTADVASTGVHDVHSDLENLHRELDRELHQIRKSVQRETENLHSATQTFGNIPSNHRIVADDDYRRQQGHGSVSASSIHRNEEHVSSTSNGAIRQLPYIGSGQRVYSSESLNSYERQNGYIPNTDLGRIRVAPSGGYSRGQTNVQHGMSQINAGHEFHTHEQQSENIHRSGNTEEYIGSDTHSRNVHNQQVSTPVVSGQPLHYREHWSAASHTKEATYPHISRDTVNGNEESAQYNSYQQRNQHNAHSFEQHNSHYNQLRQNSFNSGYRTASEKQVTGVLDTGHVEHTADCSHDVAGQLQYGSHYHRNYKRSLDKDMANLQQYHREDDLTQQTDDLSELFQQKSDGDFGQANEKYPFGHQARYWGAEDTRQVPLGNLEFAGRGDSSQQRTKPKQDLELGDLSQQTTGKLEFAAQNQGFKQENEDFSQQTGGFEDLETFERQSHKPDHSSKPILNILQPPLSQTSGKLEFGRPTQQVHQERSNKSQRVEDLTQKTDQLDDLTWPGTVPNHDKDSRNSHQLQTVTSNQDLEKFSQHARNTEDFSHATTGRLEFGEQHRNPWTRTPHNQQNQQTEAEIEDLTQQNEDLVQQTGGFDDFSQQTSGKLEFGHPSQYPQANVKPATGNQHLESFDQQNQDNVQQKSEIDDLSEQTSGKLEFGQENQKQYSQWDQSMDLAQHNEDFMQQTAGNLELGRGQQVPTKPTSHPSNTHNIEDSYSGYPMFGYYTHQSGRSNGISTNSQLESQNNAAISQQTLQNEYGKLLEQSDKHNWHWQQASNLQQGESFQQTIDSEFPTKLPNSLQIHHNEYNQEPRRDSSTFQSTEAPSGVIPLEQEHNEPHHTMNRKPAEKPKPRPRYSRPVVIESPPIDSGDVQLASNYPVLPKVDSEVDSDKLKSENLRGDQDSVIEKDKNSLDKQTHVNAFNNDRTNFDQANGLHKSNDATVGLQWHYTYHPSDLTNSEPVQNSFYPNLNYNSENQQQESKQTEQQSNLFGYHPQETSDKTSLDSSFSQLGQSQSSYSQNNRYNSHVYNSNEGLDTYSQNIGNSQLNYGQERQEAGVKGGRRRLQLQAQSKPTLEPRLEPRIIQAYGGGPYDGSNNDDIYSRAPINPSATLPPLHVEDPWDIREKPVEPLGTTIIAEIITETTPELIETTEVPTESVPPSFWGRLGHKITSTFDKAKEKARGIFG